MKLPHPTTIDFESLPIENRPDYPPPAVGVAIKPWKRRARYYAWGHSDGRNNCSWGEARAALMTAYSNPDGILCHNGKFDTDVAEMEFGLELPPWDKIHDTLFLIFLDSPDERSLSLKPSAERILGWKPEERDEIIEWLLARQPLVRAGTKLTAGQNGERYAGAYVALAPVKLVGPYAIGDVDRTEALFAKLYPSIAARGMLKAYDRERRLMPILLDMERRGIHVDVKRLEHDVPAFKASQAQLDAWLKNRLRAPDVSLDSPKQLFAALKAAGVIDETQVGVTDAGNEKTDKDTLAAACTDKQVLAALRHRNALDTCVGTFMEPWLAMARRTGGTIHTQWNQVRMAHGTETAGTRTGRLSATWFMNMPKEFPPLWHHQEPDKKKAKALPACPLHAGIVLDPPRCRGYIIPPPGHVIIDRDYSQQEPRILGHFEGGALLRSYQADPWIDFHDFARDELAKAGLHYERKPVKNTNLGLIYGMGVGKLAGKNNMTVEEAGVLKGAILALYPGLDAMYKEMRRRAAAGEPIRTWGGREYYCEEPKLIKGRWVKFDYKMVNKLVQGSAADCTKEAIIRFHDRVAELGVTTWRLILNVHDQLTVLCPYRERNIAMNVLREVMESIEFDVAMLSEGSWSHRSWADLEDYDKKGRLVRT